MKRRDFRMWSSRSSIPIRWLRLFSGGLLLWVSATWAAQSLPNSFDGDFRYFSARWLPWDYRWLQAQCYQESRLDPGARSPVGAMGLCQFMPVTWAECQEATGIQASPYNPRASIACAAWYDARLRRTWRSERPEPARRQLVQASYNAGAGNIIRAQSLCGGALDWTGIAPCLPQVTGHHAHETITYVERIDRWYRSLQ